MSKPIGGGVKPREYSDAWWAAFITLLIVGVFVIEAVL